MKVVAVVPIKLNNERFPNKNIKLFSNGKPLCHYVFKSLLGCKNIDEIYAFCSNESIKPYLLDGIRYLNRDKKLDSNTTKINEILLEFARQVDADIYVLAHVTAPFIKTESIDKGISYIEDSGYDSAFSATIIQDFLWNKQQPINYDPGSIPRTQDLDPYFMETSGFYAFKKDVLMKFNRRIGFKPIFVEVNKIEAIDIDEEEDFVIADAIAQYLVGK